MTSSHPVSHLSFVRASAGRSAELGARLQQLLEPSRQTTGCLHFSVQRSACDRDLWLLSGLWADQSALNDYFSSTDLSLFGELLQAQVLDSLDLQTFETPAAG